MTPLQDKTILGDEETGNLSHGMFADANEAKMADVVRPPRRHAASDRDSVKRPAERPKKRRRREGIKSHDESISSVPAKKARTGKLPSQAAAFDQPPQAQNTTDTDFFSPGDLAEVELHILPSIMKSVVATYKLTSMNVISSSKIQSKVTAVIEKLGTFSFAAATLPNIVLLRAKGVAASKLITIVEISKREISKAGGKWYQYNALGQILAPPEKKSAITKGAGFTLGPNMQPDIDAMEFDDNRDNRTIEEEETPFETMKSPLERAIEGKPKVQATPVILIFLSRIRSDTLKESYGEQTNALT